jgi:iron complex outermembrane receptor protein
LRAARQDGTAAFAGALLFACSSVLALAADPDDEGPVDEIVVTATRTATLIRDEPLRIEAVPAEEIEENLTIQPGNLTSLLKELPGIRVQAGAPGLGGAGLQLRGMPARHTLVLADGLPSLGVEPDSFGLLQTPPLDLKRVEVIKGAASALYGGSALGGVLNLVSQKADAESSVLANATSRGGQDLVGFFSAKGTSRWSGTLTAGAHHQSREDIDGDGWADLSGYRRITLRPRAWWQGADGHSLFLTAGYTDEDRSGGTLPGHVLPDGRVFPEKLRTRRFDVGAVSTWELANGDNFNGRFSVTSNQLDRTFGNDVTPSTETTAFAEGAWNGRSGAHQWVLGLAFEHSQLAVTAVPGVSYIYNVPAAFAQDEFAANDWLTFAGSVRVDAHNSYGTFVSPRLSALFRVPQTEWSLRASVGGGFAAPTPFVEEIEAVGLGALMPLGNLHAERATTASLDAKWADEGWDLNLSLFMSEIRDSLEVVAQPGERLELVNAPGRRRAPGAEVLLGYVAGPLHALASWSYVDATEAPGTGSRGPVALVPRQSASVDAILESERHGRVGIELDYVGKQALADNPYRATSRSYIQLNVLAEIRLGAAAIFFNAMNLTDVRQTNFDPLVRTVPGPGGDPITDVWAPLAGRTFNLGIRVEM